VLHPPIVRDARRANNAVVPEPSPEPRNRIQGVDPQLQHEIERRLELLKRFFDLGKLDGAGNTAAKIQSYYEQSRLGYYLVHSRDGAMHMALNPDGTFSKSGYEAQARLVEARLPADTRNVLELASGNGFNLSLLAPRHPDIQFRGIDLVRSQVDRANRALAAAPNAQAAVGDFQNLQLPEHVYDCVFVIESLCHATDLPRAFTEIKRVLAPGGRLIVIDAWHTELYEDSPPVVKEAAGAVERAMAVAETKTLSAWQEIAAANGLRVTEDLDLTEQIKPNLARLARVAETRYLTHPARARVLRRVLPEALLTNAVSGYLLPVIVDAGVHTYRLIVLKHA
jgi:ubiquinone/menaquinone biosynthesis C-methylase UbiE